MAINTIIRKSNLITMQNASARKMQHMLYVAAAVYRSYISNRCNLTAVPLFVWNQEVILLFKSKYILSVY